MDLDILCNNYDQAALERVAGCSLEGFNDGGRALVILDGKMRIRVDTNTFATNEDPDEEMVPYQWEICMECFTPEAQTIARAMFAEVAKVSQAVLVQSLMDVVDRAPGPG